MACHDLQLSLLSGSLRQETEISARNFGSRGKIISELRTSESSLKICFWVLRENVHVHRHIQFVTVTAHLNKKKYTPVIVVLVGNRKCLKATVSFIWFIFTENALVMVSLLLAQVGEIKFQGLALIPALRYQEYSSVDWNHIWIK